MEKHSSIPRFKQLTKSGRWKLLDFDYKTPYSRTISDGRNKTSRNNVRWWSWEFVG